MTVPTSSATHNLLECHPPIIAPFPDIPFWLRSKRLHKYDHCFQGISWSEMLKFTEADL
ncbi:hypothetical protein B0H13DRAFT_1623476 [Mycena leptocephala]|nr:hypothetical protein B0H13DRAFT_1623476 [Mycena leptocephala]